MDGWKGWTADESLSPLMCNKTKPQTFLLITGSISAAPHLMDGERNVRVSWRIKMTDFQLASYMINLLQRTNKKRQLQAHLSLHNSAFIVFVLFFKQQSEASIMCLYVSLLCHSLILSVSCWDHGEIPWNDYKRRREWRCPSSARGPWKIKTR